MTEQNAQIYTPQVGPTGSTSEDITFFGLLNEGWELFKKNWSNIFVFGGILFLVQFLIEIVGRTFFGVGTETPSISAALYSLAVLPVFAALNIGVVNVLLKIVRGQQVDIPDLFLEKKHRIIPYLLGSLVYALVYCLGLIAFIIPGIYLALKYMYAVMLIIDREMGIKQSFNLSGELTKGRKLQLVGYGIGFALFNLAGLLALGLGILITIPVSGLAGMVLYTKLLAKQEQTVGQVEGAVQSTPVAPPQPVTP